MDYVHSGKFLGRRCIVKATFKSALFTFAKDALTAIQGQTAALLIHKNGS
jgi:hypothetical protein